MTSPALARWMSSASSSGRPSTDERYLVHHRHRTGSTSAPRSFRGDRTDASLDTAGDQRSDSTPSIDAYASSPSRVYDGLASVPRRDNAPAVSTAYTFSVEPTVTLR